LPLENQDFFAQANKTSRSLYSDEKSDTLLAGGRIVQGITFFILVEVIMFLQ
jgi:hypothetical protein